MTSDKRRPPVKALIRQVMGTDNEEEIILRGIESHRAYTVGKLTGMDEEQADWEEGADEE